MAAEGAATFVFVWLLTGWMVSAGTDLTAIMRLVQPAAPPPSIAASCFTPSSSADSAQFQDCRTVGFCWQRNASSGNDGGGGYLDLFVGAGTLDGLSIFVSAHVVFQGATAYDPTGASGGSASRSAVSTVPAYTPFDLASLFQRLREGLTVRSNGTCLYIALPRIPLDIPATVAARIEFDLSHPWLYVNGLAAVPSSERAALASAFAVWVNHSAPQDSLDAFPALTVLNAVLGAATLLVVPMASALPEAAVGILAAQNGCMQPNIREPSDAVSLWVLTPFSGPGETSFEALWRCIVVVAAVPLVHAAATAVVFVRSPRDWGGGTAGGRFLLDVEGWTAPQQSSRWRNAMLAAHFPSLSIGWCLMLMPALSYASVAVLRDAEFTEKFDANHGALGILVSVVVLLWLACSCAVPPVLLRCTDVFYLRRERLVTKALCVLPEVVRLVLPGAMWGPSHRIRDWALPFTPCRERRARWCMLQWCAVVVAAAVFVPWPHEAPPCVAQYAIGGLLCLVYAGIVAKTAPFRGKALCGSIAVQAVCLGVALSMNAARCAGSYLVLPNQAIQTLLTLYHCLGIARSVLTAVCGVVEMWFVRPMVWPPEEEAVPILELQGGGTEQAATSTDTVGSADICDDNAVRSATTANSGAAASTAKPQKISSRLSSSGAATTSVCCGDSQSDVRSDVTGPPAAAAPHRHTNDGPTNDDGDDDFFDACRRRRERAEEELTMASAFANKQRRKSVVSLQQAVVPASSNRDSGGRRPRSAAAPLPPITRDALLQEPLRWLGDVAADDGAIRMVARSGIKAASIDTTQLLEVAQSARSKALLRGPMASLLHGDALHPPSIDAHAQHEVELL